MIHKASIEIMVDTEKLGKDDCVTFSVKGEPKVAEGVEYITLENYPAIYYAVAILEKINEELSAED